MPAATNGLTAEARKDRRLGQLSSQQDDLPAFHALTTDDERERKAETQQPGTFGVVVTPESFWDLPEYAAASPTADRRPSVQSDFCGLPNGLYHFGIPLTRAMTDPNIVVLDRFEDASPISTIPFMVSPASRRPSLPDNLNVLSRSPTSFGDHLVESASINDRPDERLLAHFRRYVVDRLIQPEVGVTGLDIPLSGSTRDIFEIASTRFKPVGRSENCHLCLD